MTEQAKKFIADVAPFCQEEPSVSECGGFVVCVLRNGGITTLVKMEDLISWDLEPPHWVILPESHPVIDIYDKRNDPSVPSGYSAYSLGLNWSTPRQQRGDRFDPSQEWLRGIRRLLFSVAAQ